MGQADFTGLGVVATTHEGNLGNGVMRSPERTLRDECGITAELTGDAVYLCGLEALGERQRWEDARQALRHHRLSRPWRTNHDEVMSASRRDFEGALGCLLSSHIGEVEVAVCLLFVELAAGVDACGLELPTTREEVDDIGQRLEAIDIEVVHYRRFANVLCWHDESFELLLPCTDGNGQSTADGLQRAIERELADKHIALELVADDAAIGSEQGNGKGEVEGGAFLSEVGRCHVHGDIAMREPVAEMLKGGIDAVAAFTDGGVAESGEMIEYAGCEAYFDGDGGYFESVDGSTKGFY